MLADWWWMSLCSSEIFRGEQLKSKINYISILIPTPAREINKLDKRTRSSVECGQKSVLAAWSPHTSYEA